MAGGARAAIAAGLAAMFAMASRPAAAQDPAATATAPAPAAQAAAGASAAAAAAAPAGAAPYRPYRPRRTLSAAASPPTAAAIPPPPISSPARPGARLAPGTPIPPAELEAFVDGVVRQAMADDHIAGAAVSIVQNGQPVLKKGYGYARQSPARPVDPDRTLFRLGSISKTFTWIVVMKEAERGRLGLANPINQYLPEKLQVRDQGFARPISMQDLMGHAGGFEDRVLGQLFEQDPRRIRPLATYLRQERPRRVREAGSLPVYSNYGAALAGEIAAEVAHQPFNRLAELEIFNPLGLTRTTFREPYPQRSDLPEPMRPDLAADVSEGFRWFDGELRPRPFEYLTQTAPAGAASSTAADMARYMALILNNGVQDGVAIYSTKTAEAFRTVNVRATPGVAGWAHGFHEVRLPAGFVGYGHEGETLSFRTSLTTVPDLNLGVFVAANTETGGALARRLPQLIVERFYGGPRLLPAASSAGVLNPADYDGIYLTERRAFSGLEKFVNVLTGVVRVKAGPDGRLIIRHGREARSWIALGDGRFQAADGPEVSVFAPAGQLAVRWFAPWGGEVYQRVGLLSQTPVLGLLGLLTVIAAIANLVGLATRDRRDFRQTSIQARASALQTAAAVLWLLSPLGFAVWAAGAGSDLARAVYDWPGAPLLIASACALVASLLTLGDVVLLPAIWKGGRRLDSWTIPRKLRFTVTTAIFAALAVALLLNGALEPWSG